MEKMLSKSKSRFFGKKKSSKNLGISSSDTPVNGHEKLVKEGFAAPSTHPTLPSSTPRMALGAGEPAMSMSGSPNRLHPAEGSSVESGRHMGLHNQQNSTASCSRPSHPGSVSQSHFEVHISPTAFSPILITSSTPSEPTATSPSKPRDVSTQGPKYGVTASERTPRGGEGSMHGRSQSSLSPSDTPDSRVRSRRHGIPANFLESVGAVSSGMKSHWNGQSLGAGQVLQSQTPRDRSPSSSPSQSALVHPSASAPVTSCLSNADMGLNVPELTPIHESSTDPAISSSSNGPSGRSPLPRSIPSYNLARFTPSASGMTDKRHPEEVSRRIADRSHRGNLPPHSISEVSHHSQRSLPQNSSSSSSARINEVHQHQSSNHHRVIPSMGSETEIGYNGLTFPLPPSNEEGLAMSFSSSQSSIFSTTTSGRRSGDQPSTPKKASNGTFDGEHEHDTTTRGSIERRGAIPVPGRSVKERNANLSVSETRPSPTSNMRSARRKLDSAGNDFERAPSHKSRIGTDEERDTLMHQDRVAKELEDVLSTRVNHSNDVCPPARVRAISETPRPHASNARPQKHPEPTKPLVLNTSRKTLHTMRSCTSLADQKQIHTASSTRDLGGGFNSTIERSERVRTTTAIPVRVGPGQQQDRDGHAPVSAAPVQPQSLEDKSLTPPSLPLPTPPNSSSALNFLANDAKSPDVLLARSQVGVGPPSMPPLTLEEVTAALRVERSRIDELVGQVLDVAQRHTAEKDTYVGRVGRLEGTVAKLEREIRGLRWLVLEITKVQGDVIPNATLILDALATDEEKCLNSLVPREKDDSLANDRKLRRSSTMPQLPTLVQRAGYARNRRFGGLGLDLSPESAGSSLSTLATPSRYEVGMGDGGHTPSMDEIIDKLMAVRQWAGSDVRVSVVESTGDAGDSKRIVFRQV